jgi:O-methyltransferase
MRTQARPTRRLTNVAKHGFLGALLKLGWRLERRYPRDLRPEIREIIDRIAPYGLTSAERFSALCDAVDYIVEHRVPGSIVECGVFRGASMMAVALELLRLGEAERDLYLFDTFTGMPAPSDKDVSLHGSGALERWRILRTGPDSSDWNAASVEEVRENMLATGYDERRVHLIPGKVEDTIPASAPADIALLRLDTDWYESTRHELIHLFPRLVVGGILIIDDYGHWMGARAATDEYFKETRVRILLHRIDYTGRLGIKQDALATR